MTYAEAIETNARDAGQAGELPTFETVREIVEAGRHEGELYLRVSRGPADVRTGSRHAESGYPLPGLGCWSLTAEPWWPAGDLVWVARQLVTHSYLLSENTRAWVLTGPVVGRGPDGEPLVAPARPVATVGQGAILEAESVYAAWRCRDVR